MEAIKKMISEFAAQPLAERKNKPLPPADFDENLKKLWKSRYETIAEHQERLTKLLLETQGTLKVHLQSLRTAVCCCFVVVDLVLFIMPADFHTVRTCAFLAPAGAYLLLPRR